MTGKDYPCTFSGFSLLTFRARRVPRKIPGIDFLRWSFGGSAVRSGYIAQGSCASELPEGKRDFAFGLFYIGYGVGWLISSIVSGLLYRDHQTSLILFASVVQLCSIPFFIIAERSSASDPGIAQPY